MAVKADIDFQKDLFDAATRMRGSITPSDYKHYVLPLIFLRYVSLRFDKRRAQVEEMVNEPDNIWYSEDPEVRESILNDPDQYKSENVFMVPQEARWSYLVEKANDSNIKGF
jgi:type I restriction enzyme M protein